MVCPTKTIRSINTQQEKELISPSFLRSQTEQNAVTNLQLTRHSPSVPSQEFYRVGASALDHRFAMAVASSETTNICSHCDRAIPSSNIDLHYAHCSRNLEKCKVCSEMVPRKHADEHFMTTHAPVECSLCSETVEREILAIHKGENCPQRIVTCDFCEFPLPAVDLAEHQEVCGNRTELCHLCNKYIRLRERYNHESRCTGIAENNVAPSRDLRAAAEREQRPRRRQPPPELSRKRILLTIAITGIAVLLGSLFFQRKAETTQVH